MSPEFLGNKENIDVLEIDRVLSGLYRLKANGNRHLNEEADINCPDLANEAFGAIAMAILLRNFENVNIGLTIKLIVAEYLREYKITRITIDDLYRVSPNGKEIKDLHKLMDEGKNYEAILAKKLISSNKGVGDGNYKMERFFSLEKLNSLKTLERTGWVNKKIKKGYRETVGEHIFGTVVMSLFFGSGDLEDKDHKMAILTTIHDLAECVVGDIPPNDSRAKEKHKIEMEAMKYLFRHDKEILAFFEEYEDKNKPFGKRAKNTDKTETLFQTHLYERTYNNTEVFDEFWVNYGHKDYGNLQFFVDYLKNESLAVKRNKNRRIDII